MIYRYPIKKDTSIYEQYPKLNSGDDEILEITKKIDPNYNSRILLEFDIDTVSASIATGEITGSEFRLILYATEPTDVPLEYTLYANPISGSWISGVGSFFNSTSSVIESSWLWRNNSEQWLTSSFVAGSTGSYVTSAGGGNWYTQSSYESTQSFSYSPTDVSMDITNMMNAWLSSSVANQGLILRRSASDEASSLILGTLQYYSRNTNTIYEPKLEVRWDDSSFSTGSLISLPNENYVVYSNSIRSTYTKDTKTKIRLSSRDQFPRKTFSTSSDYRKTYYLPSTSYYSIYDSVTDEQVIPFHDIYTKISCDSTGSFFNLWTNQFPVERWYKIKVKINQSGMENYFDIGSFKVTR